MLTKNVNWEKVASVLNEFFAGKRIIISTNEDAFLRSGVGKCKIVRWHNSGLIFTLENGSQFNLIPNIIGDNLLVGIALELYPVKRVVQIIE